MLLFGTKLSKKRTSLETRSSSSFATKVSWIGTRGFHTSWTLKESLRKKRMSLSSTNLTNVSSQTWPIFTGKLSMTKSSRFAWRPPPTEDRTEAWRSQSLTQWATSSTTIAQTIKAQPQQFTNHMTSVNMKSNAHWFRPRVKSVESSSLQTPNCSQNLRLKTSEFTSMI